MSEAGGAATVGAGAGDDVVKLSWGGAAWTWREPITLGAGAELRVAAEEPGGAAERRVAGAWVGA